jgi:hypothetical protein
MPPTRAHRRQSGAETISGFRILDLIRVPGGTAGLPLA